MRTHGRQALDLALIDDLHAVLMSDEAARFRVGRYREDQVWIGLTLRIEDATFVPAPPASISDCMRDMETGILKYPPLYLSGTLLRSKREYYAALASVQLRGDWVPWCALLCRAVVESCAESISIAEDLDALASRWERELRGYRADSATRRLPRFLMGHPVLPVQQAAAGLEVSIPAANAALNNLLDAGIVSLVNERRWGRLFQATDVLQRLDQAPS